MKVHAGARSRGNRAASSSSMRAKSYDLAMIEDRKDSVEPGLSTTAIGIESAIRRQRRHL